MAKLPTFWNNDPRSWFVQVDAQFALRQITQDDTKYWHVVASLDKETASCCSPIIARTPDANKYQYLREQLIKRFDLSDEERADRLLDMQTLGGRRPSELADAILQLNGNQPNHILLRRIFVRALPQTLRNALSTSTTEDLRELAREADRAYCSTGHREILSCHVAAPSDTPEVDAIAARRRQLCYFHRKWGVRAKRCAQPCEWTPSPLSPLSPASGNAQGGLR